MKYKLFLSDFDGTLVRADGTISKGNIEAIAAYRARGGIFAVVTGRMLRSILPRLHELGLTEGLVAAYQGAAVADIATGDLLKSDGFSPGQAVRAVEFLEERGAHIQAYADDVLYCNRDDDLLKMYEKLCGVKAVVPKEPLSKFLSRLAKPVPKVLVIAGPAEKQTLMRELSALGEEYAVTSSAEMLVEVLPAGVSKAQAVDFLAAHYGLTLEEVAAIGDQLNDLPMIERAGGKFAVANAEERVRRAAYVVPSCEEDGVKVALEIAMEGAYVR